MEENPQPKIDPNLADLETLQQIPGVGPKLAQLIQESRPYAAIEDLQKVSGIGPVVAERWKDLLTFSPPGGAPVETEPAPVPLVQNGEIAQSSDRPDDIVLPPPESQEAVLEPHTVTAEEQLLNPPEPVFETADGPSLELNASQENPPPSPANVKEEVKETSAPPIPAQPTGWITRSQAIWGMVITGVISLILAVALALGILAGLNGGLLQFATPNQVAALSIQAKGLDTRISVLEQDTQGLRARLDNLEGLGGRISAVENSASDLQTQMKTVSTQVATLNNDISSFQSQIDAATAKIQQFTKFLESLQSLLNGLMPLNGGS